MFKKFKAILVLLIPAILAMIFKDQILQFLLQFPVIKDYLPDFITAGATSENDSE